MGRETDLATHTGGGGGAPTQHCLACRAHAASPKCPLWAVLPWRGYMAAYTTRCASGWDTLGGDLTHGLEAGGGVGSAWQSWWECRTCAPSIGSLCGAYQTRRGCHAALDWWWGSITQRGLPYDPLGFAVSLGVVWGRPGRPGASAARVHPLLSPYGGLI